MARLPADARIVDEFNLPYSAAIAIDDYVLNIKLGRAIFSHLWIYCYHKIHSLLPTAFIDILIVSEQLTAADE